MGQFTETVEVYLENRDEYVEIEVDCEYDVLNDGIGPYEYWGQKCIDKGTDYIEITSTEWNKVGYTAEEIKVIEAEIEKEKEKWEPEIDIPDFDEREYDPCDD